MPGRKPIIRTSLQKIAGFALFGFFLLLSSTFIFLPDLAPAAVWIAVLIQMTLVVVFSVRRYRASHLRDRFDPIALIRGIVPELGLILITCLLTGLLAVAISGRIIPPVADYAEIKRSGWGIPAAVISGFLAAGVIGFGVGNAVRWFHGKATRRSS